MEFDSLVNLHNYNKKQSQKKKAIIFIVLFCLIILIILISHFRYEIFKLPDTKDIYIDYMEDLEIYIDSDDTIHFYESYIDDYNIIVSYEDNRKYDIYHEIYFEDNKLYIEDTGKKSLFDKDNEIYIFVPENCALKYVSINSEGDISIFSDVDELVVNQDTKEDNAFSAYDANIKDLTINTNKAIYIDYANIDSLKINTSNIDKEYASIIINSTSFLDILMNTDYDYIYLNLLGEQEEYNITRNDKIINNCESDKCYIVDINGNPKNIDFDFER